MIEVSQIQPKLYQTIIEVDNYITQNTFGQHSNLTPGEYRRILNFEIYGNYIKSRRGTQVLFPSSDPSPTPVVDQFVKASITWDIGVEEFLIFFANNKVWQIKIAPVISEPDQILGFGGGSADIGTLDNEFVPDLTIEGGRLYVFHPERNAVIEITGTGSTTFQVRDMGMVAPAITSVAAGAAGAVGGLYTYGIEKVYQKDGGDFLGSSPNRFKIDRTLAHFGPIDYASPVKVNVTVDFVELENDALWTHVRLWRSKTQTTDNTDTANPVDPVGVPEELYEVALVTRAELEFVGVAAIATSTDKLLPAGNINTEAGQPGGPGTVFTIIDNSTDEFLTLFAGLEEIELQPIPNCSLGVSHSNRIFFADLATNLLSDGSTIQEKVLGSVFYSDNAATNYGEQFKRENLVPVPLDGQNITKLISFEKELIIVKEAKTLRLPSGDVTQLVEMLDPRIGTSDKGFLQFIPTIGICGITNDYGDFRIFGFDFVWRSTFNSIEISKPVRLQMNALDVGRVSIIYINGKLIVANKVGNAYVLNVEQGLGWSEFKYLSDDTDQYFTFANGSRAGIVGRGQYPLEIEVEDLDTDINLPSDPTGTGPFPIVTSFTTAQFQVQAGSDVIEHEWLSLMAKLDSTATAIPYVNDTPWPDPENPQVHGFNIDPLFFSNVESLNDREHRLFVPPAPQGIFLFTRMMGNFLHYQIDTEAPCIFKAQRLHCIVDEDGIAWGGTDPFQVATEVTGTIEETGVAADTYEETGTAVANLVETGFAPDGDASTLLFENLE